MRGVRAILGGLALCAALAPAASAAPVGPLSHEGRWVTDSQGRVAILHGVNMVSKRAPYAPDATGFGDDDAAFLASEGYDTVRLGVIYAAVEPQPGHYDDAYLDRIAQTVATLGRHGINALLDFHQDLYNERFQGEGWPEWAVRDDGLPAQPQLGFPGNYLGQPALNRAFDNFWANKDGLQDSYAAAWQHVAQRFRGNPHVLGYDLMNEPWPGTQYPTCANPAGCPVFDATLAGFYKKVIGSIRSVDPDSLVWAEPNVIFNDGADTNLGDLGDSKTGLSFHDYCLLSDAAFTDGDPLGNSECEPFDNLVFQHADAYASKVGSTLLLTEFGATTDTTVLRKMADRADQFMVGWQEWHYCACDDPTTSGPGNTQALVKDPHQPPTGDNLDPNKLGVLSRPYPQAVAGTPTAYGFDQDSKTFTLTYSTAAPDQLRRGAVTEIATPARQYPNGYRATVTGGRVTSRAGAGVLHVATKRGATSVSVRVTPA